MTDNTREEASARDLENSASGEGSHGKPDDAVSPSLLDLDVSLLLRVFGHLPLRERLFVLPCVCRLFRDLVWDEIECRKIFEERFSTSKKPGRTYFSRLVRSVGIYQRDKLLRVSALLRRGLEPTRANLKLRKACITVRLGNEVVLRRMLSKLAKEKTDPEEGWSARHVLHEIVEKGDKSTCFEVLLDTELTSDLLPWPKHMAVASVEEKILSIAYSASRRGALKCLGVLEKRGLNFGSLDPTSHDHPLLGALHGANTECFAFLLERGVTQPKRLVSQDGILEPRNLFAEASLSRSRGSVKMLEFLEEGPFVLDCSSFRSSRGFLNRLADARDVALFDGTADAFQYLIKRTDRYRRTQLSPSLATSLVAMHCQIDDHFEASEKLRTLIDRGANLDAPVRTWGLRDVHEPEAEDVANLLGTPLQMCCTERRYQSVFELLEAGANPNVHAENLPPPLHIVLDDGDNDFVTVPVVRALLYFGADPGLKFVHPSYPQHGLVDAETIALHRKTTALFQVLRDHIKTP